MTTTSHNWLVSHCSPRDISWSNGHADINPVHTLASPIDARFPLMLSTSTRGVCNASARSAPIEDEAQEEVVEVGRTQIETSLSNGAFVRIWTSLKEEEKENGCKHRIVCHGQNKYFSSESVMSSLSKRSNSWEKGLGDRVMACR